MLRLKNIFFLLFSLLLIAGCSGSVKNKLTDWMKDTGRVKIISTTAQIGDLVSEIGGDRIDGLVLIEGDLDPHSYELVKGDGEKFDRADLIFYNGLGLEHGASLASLLHANPKALPIGEEIFLRHPEKILKRGGAIDPHIWMDISLWVKGVDPIVEKLSSLDPDGASFYRARGDLLIRKMESSHQKIWSILQEIPSEKRYLVTSHDAFHYFTRGYLAGPDEIDAAHRFAAPEGLAPDGQLSPIDIQKIIYFLQDRKISVLFPETNVSRDSIKKIASAGKELGLEIRICQEPLYGDSMSGLSYLEMMEKNAQVIAEHLGP
jgi:manganese/zinc/iron transport system substrate-binding protein